MNRRQWHVDRITDAYQEFVAAEASVGLLEERLRVDPSFLTSQGIGNRRARALRDNLEATYLIRLFAAFEAGVRDAWENHWKKPTEPKMMDLINSVGGRRSVPNGLINRVHAVREYRNGLIHASGKHATAVEIRDCQEWLCAYFNRLPNDW
jgi:hypothetical protein